MIIFKVRGVVNSYRKQTKKYFITICQILSPHNPIHFLLDNL